MPTFIRVYGNFFLWVNRLNSALFVSIEKAFNIVIGEGMEPLFFFPCDKNYVIFFFFVVLVFYIFLY